MQEFFTKEVIWFLIGMILFLAELIVPGMVLLFFGIGAWITAIICLLFDVSINLQLAIFLISSVITLLSLRRFLKAKYINKKAKGSAELEDDYIGKTATALEDFDATQNGKVQFKGIVWDAATTSNITKGQNLIIIGFESIKLIVEPLNNSNGS